MKKTVKNQKSLTRVNKKWFLEKLENAEISQRQLAFKLGIEPSSLNLVLKGKRKLQSHEAAEIARILVVPLEDVLSNAGVNVPGSGSIEITGSISEELEVKWGAVKGPRQVPYPLYGAKDIEAIRFDTAGGPYAWLDGGLLFYSPKTALRDDFLGRLCLVHLKDQKKNPWVLRIVRRGYEAGTYSLSSIKGEKLEVDVHIKELMLVEWIRL